MLYSIIWSKMTPFLIYEAPHGSHGIRYPMGGRVKFRKVNKNCNYSANFKNFCNFFFYMGLHFVDFTFAFDTTLIRLVMTEIWLEYVGQAFSPPP